MPTSTDKINENPRLFGHGLSLLMGQAQEEEFNSDSTHPVWFIETPDDDTITFSPWMPSDREWAVNGQVISTEAAVVIILERIFKVRVKEICPKAHEVMVEDVYHIREGYQDCTSGGRITQL